MLQRAFELESAAADVARFRGDFDAGSRGDELPGFGGFLAVDQDLAGHDERLGFLAGVGETAIHDHSVQSLLCKRGLSRLSVDDQIGDLVQALRTRAKGLRAHHARELHSSCAMQRDSSRP